MSNRFQGGLHRFGRTTELLVGALLLSGVMLAPGLPAVAGIVTDPTFPTEGEAVTVRITDSEGQAMGATPVRARYRPGSEVERTEEIGTTAADGTVSWTPTGAGVVAVEAGPVDAPALSQNLSVRFRGVPFSGLLILLGAGIVLYGGVIRGFRSLSNLPAHFPPDT